MSTPPVSILCFLIASLLGAAGQFLYREGARQVSGGLMAHLLNVRMLLGAACYIGVMMLFVAAFKRGGALTVLYPIYATTFIWAALIAWGVDGQPIKLANVGGMALLVAGMWLMGK